MEKKVFCSECRYFNSLSKQRQYIFCQDKNGLIFKDNINGHTLGTVLFKVDTKDDVIQIIHNSSDFCKAKVDYVSTYLTVFEKYGNPSEINKDNNCKLFKPIKRWLFRRGA